MMERMERVHHQQMSKLMTKNETKEKSFKSRITRLDQLKKRGKDLDIVKWHNVNYRLVAKNIYPEFIRKSKANKAVN